MPGDSEDVDELWRELRDDRESSIEDVLADVRDDLGRQSYPTTSEDLAATYADEPTDIPNETESLGSAFDRIDDQFGDADEAFAAFLAEFERGAHAEGSIATRTGGDEWSEERVDDDRPPAEENAEGQQERAKGRASRAQAIDAESSTGSSGGSG